MKKLLTKREAAELLGVSIRAIDYYRGIGLPSHTIGDKLIRFSEDEVEEWALGRSSGKDNDEQTKEDGNAET